MIVDDSVFLDIPRFVSDMDKEVLDEEDVFDVITGNILPSKVRTTSIRKNSV